MWEHATITDAGANLLASWITGSTFNITRAAAGTGTDTDLYSATALHDEKATMSIISVQRDGGNVIVKLQAVAAVTAYTMNQIGIWANVDSGATVLFAIFQDDTGISVPQAATSQEFIYNFYATLLVSNTGTLNVSIDSSAAVSMETMTEALKTKEDKINAVGLLKRTPTGQIVPAEAGVDYDTGTGSYYGTSTTAAASALKIVAVEDLSELVEGALFVISFDNANTAANPYIKVNDNTPYIIVSPRQLTLSAQDYWLAGEFCLFMWDGTAFVLLLRFARYIPLAQKGAVNGVASLGADGKVLASQLRGGFIVSATAPEDTTLLWIDGERVMRFYDTRVNAWKTVLPTWG